MCLHDKVAINFVAGFLSTVINCSQIEIEYNS